MKYYNLIPILLILALSFVSCYKKEETKPRVKSNTIIKIDTSKGISYPYTDTFYGIWNDYASGDLYRDTSFNTPVYVVHEISDFVKVYGDLAVMIWGKPVSYQAFPLYCVFVFDTAS